jgi:lipid-A-disaccharide synthase
VHSRTYDMSAPGTRGFGDQRNGHLGDRPVRCARSGVLQWQCAQRVDRKRLVDIKYISLVNLIMDREVVTELIQSELTVEKLSKQLERIAAEGPDRKKLLSDLEQLREMLGGPGASARVANAVWISLQGGGEAK